MVLYWFTGMDELPTLNITNFEKMAHGDADGLRELAFDFFSDMRRLLPDWSGLVESGGFDRLREEFHRCKGGASLFGLERMVAILSRWEKPGALEQEFDLQVFEQELSAAEKAVKDLAA